MIYRYIYKITCTSGSFKDKFYFGQRTTYIDPSKDKYKGSGRKIGDYYKKHPNDYIKEIISFHNSQEELNKAEYEIIKPWLGDEMCLNLCGGGNICELTEESRKRRSESLSGEKNGMFGKQPWNKGLSYPLGIEKHKEIGEKNHGRIQTEQEKNKRKESRKQYFENGGEVWNKGKECPSISIGLKEHYEIYDIWNKDKKDCYSETALNNMSNGQKRRYQNPDEREKSRQRVLGKFDGKDNPMYGTHYLWINNRKERKRVKPEELEYYLKLGWKKGYKLESI